MRREGLPPSSPLLPTPSEDTLTLPDGALIAMRKSGGFRFTSTQITVYHDGRVEVGKKSKDVPTSTRKLSDNELAKLYRALDGANLPELPATVGYQSPDAYAYEIAANLGQTTYNVEMFDRHHTSAVSPTYPGA